ncbi:MAG TPA: ABC transporter ATP-binding protein [Chondromyces sp.]|nr:ABC transporter ATP-binding protein [Chondromyces sp.]
MIEIRGVTKGFDHAEAVKGINMQINRGSIYGLLGSNGAGKTTLLKMMAGIYKPDSGSITVLGEEIYENGLRKQKVLFLPDTPYFFPQATINQLARFYQGMYPSWNEGRFQELSSIFSIPLNKKVHRLSKGMRRQVLFWLALSCMPEYLLLDEPLDGLDAVMRKKIKQLLVEDVAEREMTIILSSHHIRELEDLCDHIGILHKGELLMEKELDELKMDIHKIQIAFKGEIPNGFLKSLNVVHQEKRGSVLLCIVRGKEKRILSIIESFRPVVFDILPLTLEEIFIYEMEVAGYAIENVIVS